MKVPDPSISVNATDRRPPQMPSLGNPVGDEPITHEEFDDADDDEFEPL